MIYNYDLQPTLTINSEDLENITADVRSGVRRFYTTGTTTSAWTASDPFMEEFYISIDNKLIKYANAIYDVLKDLGRIEIAREEWLALITDKLKE